MAKSIINDTGSDWILPSRGISIIGSMKAYNTYQDLLVDQHRSAFAWVNDATGDPTVNQGGALYYIKDGNFVKMLETEAMDQIFDSTVYWDDILDKPDISVLDLNDVIAKKHSHDNKFLLDKLTHDDADNLVIGSATIVTDKNIQSYIPEQPEVDTHSHSNLQLLETIQENSDGSISLGKQTIVTENTLEKLKLVNVINDVQVDESQETISLDLTNGNYFIVTGSENYTPITFSGNISNVSGTIVVRGGSSVLWPVGEDTNGFYWVWGTTPQDISSNPNTDIIVLDYRVVDNIIFINEVCSKIGDV